MRCGHDSLRVQLQAVCLPVRIATLLDARRRHYQETQRGQVVAFAMQLEVEVGDAWVPVVRYDTAHGVPHVHRYETMTHASRQTLEMPAGEALTLAQEDLAQNWSQYRDEFVRRIR